jgi:hypothetical protein
VRLLFSAALPLPQLTPEQAVALVIEHLCHLSAYNVPGVLTHIVPQVLTKDVPAVFTNTAPVTFTQDAPPVFTSDVPA